MVGLTGCLKSTVVKINRGNCKIRPDLAKVVETAAEPSDMRILIIVIGKRPSAPRTELAFSGFILFLCCDICVALSYLSHENMLPVWMYGLMNYLDWAFYYPAQVLISNSSAITDQPRRRKPHFFKKKQKKELAVK